STSAETTLHPFFRIAAFPPTRRPCFLRSDGAHSAERRPRSSRKARVRHAATSHLRAGSRLTNLHKYSAHLIQDFWCNGSGDGLTSLPRSIEDSRGHVCVRQAVGAYEISVPVHKDGDDCGHVLL